MRKGASSLPGPTRRIRVRSRPLEEIDEAKVALALWIMAKRLAEESGEVVSPAAETPSPSTKEEVA
jgi:hypothetical protein